MPSPKGARLPKYGPMGYTTEFDGSVSISPPLNAHEIAYLRKFAASRRMDRARGPYFVDGSGPFGQAMMTTSATLISRQPDNPDCGAGGSRPRTVQLSNGTAWRSSITPKRG
jgi:hypothetical protein